MNINNIVAHSLDLIEHFTEDAYNKSMKDEEYRLAFIYRHTRNICDLGNDCLFLYGSGRTSGAYILIRPLLESLFNLCAAVNNEKFAIEKFLYEIDHDIRKLTKWKDLYGDSAIDDSMAILSTIRNDINKQYSILQTKNWNTLETAKEARLSQQYVQAYFMFSRHTHSSTGGIIMQEQDDNNGMIPQSLAFIILAGVGHAAQVLPSSSPQQYIGSATKFLKELVKSIESEKEPKTEEGKLWVQIYCKDKTEITSNVSLKQMQTPSIDKRIDFWKYTYARSSFRETISYCDLLLKEQGLLSQSHRKGLITALAVAYTRPFTAVHVTKEKRIFSVDESIIPVEYIQLHREYIEMRNSFFAHKDATKPEIPGGTLNQVRIVVDNRHQVRWQTTQPDGMESERLKSTKELCQILAQNLQVLIQDFIQAEIKPLHLEMGAYVLQIEPAEDEWLKRVE